MRLPALIPAPELFVFEAMSLWRQIHIVFHTTSKASLHMLFQWLAYLVSVSVNLTMPLLSNATSRVGFGWVSRCVGYGC